MSGNRNRRSLWWVWAVWLAMFAVLEAYALATKERVVPTLSRTWWWVRDRWPWVALLMAGFLTWLFLHLVFGECALNLC